MEGIGLEGRTNRTRLESMVTVARGWLPKGRGIEGYYLMGLESQIYKMKELEKWMMVMVAQCEDI